ncbi:uncharacterized protein MONOS_12233 [Monocercomonoides exilis]|uniref:uncharacterized protein n=1 Tax=Monocercomonoides exilis TaxID=2049356 RepID=UPI00355A8BD9|nr:hypothetical protein MONOS_12233 [Monocercomonoides exilis]|eukprot:MONOS_12233.1-p1 / transcript=MONOS_12233.1 / gene=MONOS_12233 / organism=Monocercomonoides_exilis_PA203 / gene_product=unspecified product / transcript_product=unspecified product / location=Mono_scaffold00663:11527-13834(+) / protein_length=741 / sequence_SO=supercontig / SO=protein_coding / is_pseudo=false
MNSSVSENSPFSSPFSSHSPVKRPAPIELPRQQSRLYASSTSESRDELDPNPSPESPSIELTKTMPVPKRYIRFSTKQTLTPQKLERKPQHKSQKELKLPRVALLGQQMARQKASLTPTTPTTPTTPRSQRLDTSGSITPTSMTTPRTPHWRAPFLSTTATGRLPDKTPLPLQPVYPQSTPATPRTPTTPTTPGAEQTHFQPVTPPGRLTPRRSFEKKDDLTINSMKKKKQVQRPSAAFALPVQIKHPFQKSEREAHSNSGNQITSAKLSRTIGASTKSKISNNSLNSTTKTPIPSTKLTRFQDVKRSSTAISSPLNSQLTHPHVRIDTTPTPHPMRQFAKLTQIVSEQIESNMVNEPNPLTPNEEPVSSEKSSPERSSPKKSSPKKEHCSVPLEEVLASPMMVKSIEALMSPQKISQSPQSEVSQKIASPLQSPQQRSSPKQKASQNSAHNSPIQGILSSSSSLSDELQAITTEDNYTQFYGSPKTNMSILQQHVSPLRSSPTHSANGIDQDEVIQQRVSPARKEKSPQNSIRSQRITSPLASAPSSANHSPLQHLSPKEEIDIATRMAELEILRESQLLTLETVRKQHDAELAPISSRVAALRTAIAAQTAENDWLRKETIKTRASTEEQIEEIMKGSELVTEELRMRGEYLTRRIAELEISTREEKENLERNLFTSICILYKLEFALKGKEENIDSAWLYKRYGHLPPSEWGDLIYNAYQQGRKAMYWEELEQFETE